MRQRSALPPTRLKSTLRIAAFVILALEAALWLFVAVVGVLLDGNVEQGALFLAVIAAAVVVVAVLVFRWQRFAGGLLMLTAVPGVPITAFAFLWGWTAGLLFLWWFVGPALAGLMLFVSAPKGAGPRRPQATPASAA